MKKSDYYLLTIITMLFAFIVDDLSAQDTFGGSVKYQQTRRYDFSARKSQRWKDYVATLPQEGNYAFVLNFTKKHALYEENTAEQEAPAQGLQRALHAINRSKPPKPELKKVFYDLENNKKTKQLEFMTRDFIIESDIKSKKWKISNEKKKILDYICMSAELKIKEKTITAWFTPQIPVSLGPDKFYGLPGLILAVEKNGETVFLATSINLSPPQKNTLSKPKDGKKVTPEEFKNILKEKAKEFKENSEKRKGKMGGRR